MAYRGKVLKEWEVGVFSGLRRERVSSMSDFERSLVHEEIKARNLTRSPELLHFMMRQRILDALQFFHRLAKMEKNLAQTPNLFKFIQQKRVERERKNFILSVARQQETKFAKVTGELEW